ncbi:MAG: hypothetical protein WA672_17560 [Candidatus Angelobacter sp.]
MPLEVLVPSRHLKSRLLAYNLTVQEKVFDVHYADSRTAVVLEADLDRGWKKLQKTYGFFTQTRIPFKDDLTIRTQLSLIAQPGSFNEWAQEFPDVGLELTHPLLSYSIVNRHLVMKVSLSPEQRWRTTEQGRPEIFIAEQPLMTSDHGRWYDLRAWLVFHESPKRPIPDVRVWVENKLFIPGGRIESNRKRH